MKIVLAKTDLLELDDGSDFGTQKDLLIANRGLIVPRNAVVEVPLEICQEVGNHDLTARDGGAPEQAMQNDQRTRTWLVLLA